MKRRGYESLARRLAKRECHGAPPGAVAPQSRRLYESVVPDTAVPGVVPPPNTVLYCFTPCGHFLVAFQPVSNEVVAFRFKGLNMGISASAPQPTTVGGGGLRDAPARAAGADAARAAGQPQPADSSHSAADQPAQAPAQQEKREQRREVAFGDVFEEHWRCCPCPGRREHICTDFCMVVHGRFLMVATSSPERQPPASAQGAAQLVPAVDATTFHLVGLESGSLLDSHTIHSDYVELARNQGAHLRGHLLLVLGLASQTLYVLQLLPAGRFLYLHAVGQHCREDDAWVIAQQEERERRLRQQQRWRPPPAVHSTLAAVSSFSSLGAAVSGGAGSAAAWPSPSQQPRWQPSAPVAAPGARPAPAAAAAAVAAQGSVSDGGEDGDEMEEEEEAAAHSPGAGGGAWQPRGAPSPLIGGLKQCLLSCLFREAQHQSLAVAAAAAEAASEGGRAAGGSQAPGAGMVRGLARASGSTGNLPSATAAAAPPPQLQRVAGSSGNLAGLQGAAARQHGGGGGLGLLPHWRRPLDRFYYYFEAHLELLMWKAQLLDDQRLLIHWCPPEMLAGPHRHQHHGHAPSSSSGQHGSYLMLYNTAAACVEHLFVAHSPELAAWYLQQPGAFHGGGCGCGCGTDWERWVAPPAASRAAREQQLRDPLELRHRLAEEVPASSQLRQATPYLDPDLYCYDERAIGGAIRPHHPPHRHPERLRFRLDPEHLQPVAAPAGSRAAAAAAARAHLTYLFHPVQPFLLVVVQDIETAMAERLTLFTRL
ncbi:hypothetical protein CHLNCDRAFT_143175 [Chlorella variabilis]|uniref:Uncharacterized protein n=1 Tax=Chlorella variabilis TaxID=554065 RepID=E1Z9M5_CHLVA|nr:hypothetical protein CHLNCDRAFT_143175 [Chlorella variabilis]EFN57545.1 hypothetical protein CHLNCDRAFT_143175 [Chlorella variabilis]|eukprot:XP_005849647.1 hypothetical protein CHLNCDRAFT_143175 [Chlorella variabilis]